MKKTTVKGFTLIEMLIVLATFSVIMFGAMQLMQPSRMLYERSFKEEDVSAGEKILKNYLEDTLRFAQNVDVSSAAYDPDDDSALRADLTTFVRNHYNGYRTNTGALGSGVVNVMWINNRNHGMISTQSFTFTAPDIDPTGDIKTDVTLTDNSDYTPSAVNLAIYNRYNYVISLGVTTTEIQNVQINAVDKMDLYHLVTDADYYAKFPAAMHIDECCRDSFTFTINGYDTHPTQKALEVGGDWYYSQIIPMTANMSLVNAQNRENYLHYDWKEESSVWKHPTIAAAAPGGTPETKWCRIINDNLGVDSCHLLGDTAGTGTGLVLDSNTWSEGTFTDYANPDTIRIIYSYPLK